MVQALAAVGGEPEQRKKHTCSLQRQLSFLNASAAQPQEIVGKSQEWLYTLLSSRIERANSCVKMWLHGTSQHSQQPGLVLERPEEKENR